MTEARKRVVMLEVAPRRRAQPEPVQGELVLDGEAFVGYTPWFPHDPVLTGWYDLRCKPWPFPGNGPHERLWFDGTGKAWRASPGGQALPLPDDREWRGLAAHWPGGYSYLLLSARRRRAVLEAP